MQQYTVKPIGIVHCRIRSVKDAPKSFDESDQTGVLEIFPQYREAMDGIEAGQTLIALFWLHKAARDIMKVHPRGDLSRPRRGVFTTRSPVRPNPIALSELKITVIRDTMLEVAGLDVIDGTPLLDLKKR